MERDADVVVVGAGPTGLLLAGDLAGAGVRTLVLERRETGSNLSRAFAVHARTLELLDARGVADDLVHSGRRVDRLRVFGQVRVDMSRLPTRFPFILITPQYRTEDLLAERARLLGAEFVTGQQVTRVREPVVPESTATGATATGDGVVEVTADGVDGRSRTWRASFVVGADGVRSAVRMSLGVPFPGRSVLRSVMLADVRLDRPPADPLTVNATPDGFALIVAFGDGWYRVIAWNRSRQLPDDHPVDLDDLRETTARVLGTDHGIRDARWTSRFHNDERQVPAYRQGRVFLAGDAAHVHSPAGGLGMNTGLQDAANLGWKLARCVRGPIDEALLDSYHQERHPVGRDVVRLSGGILRAALLDAPRFPQVRARVAATLTRIPAVNDALAMMISGLAVRYAAEPGAGPHAGRRAPDFRLESEPARLYRALRGGGFVLLSQRFLADPRVDLPPDLRVDLPPDLGADRLMMGADRPVDRVTQVRPVGYGPAWMLVRPDGYVAADSVAADPATARKALRAALRRWVLGASSTVSHA